MNDDKTSVWKDEQARQLAEALVTIDSVQTMRNFLRDVMTEKEIIEISARLEAARMLQSGAKYTDIIKATKLSSRTIARISDWLKTGCSGYAVALATLNDHSHMSPARAE